MRIAVLLLGPVLLACRHVPPPQPEPVPIPPAPIPSIYAEDELLDGLGTQGGTSCRALRAIGCAEGFRDARTKHTCFQRLEHEAQLVRVPYACVAAAKTADEVRRCGTKDTLRFRCAMPSVDD